MIQGFPFFLRSRTWTTALLLLLLIPSLSLAQTIREHEAQKAEDAERPFKIENRSQFACAEVGQSESGGATSHEINLTPRQIERCELIKVGTRLHECKKYRYQEATIDNRGIVKIATEDGPVEFWFDQESRITGGASSQLHEGGGKGTLIFQWPDKKTFRYLCASMF